MPSTTDWKDYRDFILKIERAEGGVYRVEAQGPTGEAESAFTLPFDQRDLEIFLLKVGHPRRIATRGRVPEPIRPTVEFGRKLYESVVSGPVRDLFVRARQDAERENYGLRVQLRLNSAPELADIPWEFLYDGHDFLGLSGSTPIVRYLDLQNKPRPVEVDLPLRILVTISTPLGLPELKVATEKGKIEQALATLLDKGVIRLDFTPDAQLSTLQRELRQARRDNRPYHIWHYIGHGTYDEAQQASTLVFCDAEGLPNPIVGFQLGTLFNSYPDTRLVLLNACEGARPNPKDPFAGVSAALVERGIPAVIGMQFEISDEAGILLAGMFYEAIVDGLPVDAALVEARRAVFFMPNWVEWATPVLFLRAPTGQIFEVSPLSKPGFSTGKFKRPQIDQPSQSNLSELYTDALAAYYTLKWERAVEILSQIVAQDAGFKDAAIKLTEARQQVQAAAAYAQAQQAMEALDWDAAIQAFDELLQVTPDYRDAASLREQAARQRNCTQLYDEARALFQAEKWEAVLNVLARLKNEFPEFPDSENFQATAQEKLEALAREHKVAEWYATSLHHMAESDWASARGLLLQIQQEIPGYKESKALLARVEEELQHLADIDWPSLIYLKLTPNPPATITGQDVKWTLTVRNDTATTLSKVNIHRSGTLVAGPFVLEDGRSRRFTFTLKYSTVGSRTTDITFVGVTPKGIKITKEVSQSVRIKAPPKPKPSAPKTPASKTPPAAAKTPPAAAAKPPAPKPVAATPKAPSAPIDSTFVHAMISPFTNPQEKFYLAPNIPEDKLSNAVARTQAPAYDKYIALLDLTVSSNAKDCLLFGVHGIYYYYLGTRLAIPYPDFPNRQFSTASDWFLSKSISVGKNQTLVITGATISAKTITNILNAIRTHVINFKQK